MGASTTLKVGDKVPDFTLSAANRPGMFSLAEARRRQPVVVEFLRGTWCPNCKKRMAQLERYRPQLEERNLALLYVAAEKRTGIFHPDKYLAEHPISFPFLLDEDRSVTRAWGVYHRLAKDAINIARPASFLVDPDGIARFIYVGMEQRDRAPIEAILEIARTL